MSLTLLVNLGTIAFVLVVLAVFRQNDQRSRAFDRIKKFGDKLQHDLSSIADARADELQQYAIDVEVRQQAARKLMEHLKRVEDGLLTKTAHFDELEKRLAEYDQTIINLQTMTKELQGTLDTINSESTFANSIAKKLEAYRKSIDKLEKDIPFVTQEFDRLNQEALTAHKEDMLGEASLQLTEMLTTMTTVQENIEARVSKANHELAQIEAHLTGLFARAHDDAENLSSKAFAQLSQATEQHAKALGQRLELLEEEGAAAEHRMRERTVRLEQENKEVTSSLAQNFAQVIAEQRGLFDASFAEIQDKISAALADSGAKLVQTQGLHQEIKAISETSQVLAADVQKDFHEFSTRLNNDIESIDERLKNFSSEFMARLSSLDSDLHSDLSEKAGRLEKSLAVSEEKLSTRLGGIDSTFQKNLEQLDGALNEKLSAATSKAESDFAALNAKIEGDVALTNTKLGSELGRIEKILLENLASAGTKIAKDLSELEGRANSFLQELEAKISSKVQAIDKDAHSEIATVSSMLQDKVAHFDTQLKNNFESVNTELNKAIAHLQDEMTTTISALEEKLAGFNSLLENNVQELTERSNTQLHNLDNKLHSDLSTIESSLSHNLKTTHDGFVTRLNDELHKLRTNTDNFLADLNKNISADINRVATDSHSLLATIEARGKDETHAIDTKLNQSIMLLNDIISTKIKTTNDELTEKIERELLAVDAEAQQRGTALTQKVESTYAEIRKNTEEELVRLETSLREQAKERSQKFMSEGTLQTQEILGQFNSRLTEYANGIEGQFTKLEAMLDDVAIAEQALREHIGQVKTNLDGEFAGYRQNFHSEYASFKAEHLQDLSALKDSVREFETRLAGLRDEVYNKAQLDIKEMEASLRKAMEEEQKVLNKDLQNFAVSFQEEKNKFYASQDEQAENLRAGISGLADDLAKLRAQAYDRAHSNIEEVERNLKIALEQTEQRVYTDFTKFADTFSQDEKVFKEQSENTMVKLKAEIDEINASLDALKVQATESVSKDLRTMEADLSAQIIDVQSALNDKIVELNRISSDVEANLRKDIVGMRDQIENEFKDFLNELGQEKKQLHEQQREDYSSLQKAVLSLEEDLHALKTKAYHDIHSELEQMSEKVRAGHRELEAELAARSTALAESEALVLAKLNTQKENYDAKIAQLQAAHEGWLNTLQNKIEAEQLTHVENLSTEVKTKINELRAQTAQELATIEEIQSSQLANLNNELKTHVEELRTRASEDFSTIADNQSKFVTNLSTELEAQVEELRSLASQEFSTIASEQHKQVANLNNELKTQVEELRTRASEDFSAIAGDQSTQVEKLNAALRAQIAAVQAQASQDFSVLLDDFRKEYIEKQNEYIDITDAKREALSRDVQNLNERTVEIRKELGNHINQVLSNFNQAYTKYTQDLELASQNVSHEVDRQLLDFQTAREDMLIKIESARSKALEKIDNEVHKLTSTVNQVKDAQSAFVNETRVFEQATELKNDLNQAISNLHKDLETALAQKKHLTEVEEKLATISRLEEEINQKAIRFNNEQKHLENIEKNFDTISATAHTVERKLGEITAYNDKLFEAENNIRTILELASSAENKAERLDKKTALIETTTAAVDKNFEKLKVIEANIHEYQNQLLVIPQKIAELNQGLVSVAATAAEVDKVVSKLNSLETISANTEERLANMEKVRLWLAKAETRLEEINRQAEEQLKLFSTLLSQERGRDRGSAPPPATVQDAVRKLTAQGWEVDEVARSLKISRSEVELILQLPRNS